MKNQYLIYIVLALVVWVQPILGQEKRGNETLTFTYISTLDHHSGGLISLQGFLDDHVFTNYAIGASQSHFFDWEYIVNFDIGYQFQFNNYTPDIRVGFGYLFGEYKYENTARGEVEDISDMEVMLTTTVKLGLLNWDLFPSHRIPIRLIANMGLQGQFPMNGRFPENEKTKWFPMLETGLGYQF